MFASDSQNAEASLWRAILHAPAGPSSFFWVHPTSLTPAPWRGEALEDEAGFIPIAVKEGEESAPAVAQLLMFRVTGAGTRG